MKACLDCCILKDNSEYSKNSKRSDGLEYYCKTCRNAQAKKYRDSHKKEIAEKLKIYATINKEKVYSKQKEWKLANLSKVKDYFLSYYQAHKSEIRDKNKDKSKDRVEYNRQWRSKNRDRASIIQYNRVCRIRGATGTITNQEWKELKLSYGNRCINPDCLNPHTRLTKDHIVPITKGGANRIDNIQPLCASCNSKKHTETIDYRVHWR